MQVAELMGKMPGQLELAMHEFTMKDSGGVEHRINGELRATIDGPHWADYCAALPEAAAAQAKWDGAAAEAAAAIAAAQKTAP